VIWQGHLAVDFFFLLSGFILAYTYVTAEGRLRGTRREFWVARIARIYPVYLLGLLLGLYPNLASGVHLRGLVFSAGAHIFLIHAWLPSTLAWNRPSWSLSVGALFYAVLPLILPRVEGWRRRNVWLLFVASWALFALIIVLLSVHSSVDWWRASLPCR
jgi:peptidoglycan/LPS O-acetylase OafA/YrhL